MPRLAMRKPGTQFSADGLSLSWPLNGEREVVEVPDEQITLRIRRRIAEGHIAFTDEKATKREGDRPREYRLLTGEDARKHKAEPAGPVTRFVHLGDEEPPGYVQTAEHVSERAKAAEDSRLQQLEDNHAAVTKRQQEAEKLAEKERKAAEKEEREETPVERQQRELAEQAAAAGAAAEERLVERIKAQIREEQEFEKEAEKVRKAAQKKADSETHTANIDGVQVTTATSSKAHDEAVMAREKEREAEEKKVEKERQKQAKEAAKAAETEPKEPYAGLTDPAVIRETGEGRQ